MDISIKSSAFLSTFDEPCPATSLDGYYLPDDNQRETLISADGRLNPSLRDSSLVQWGDAAGTLASAAVFRLVVDGEATASPGFGGADNPDIPNAIADLAVTGSTNLGSFRGQATVESDGVFSYSIDRMRNRVFDGLSDAADRMGVTLPSGDETVLREAVDTVLDRALLVIWALHGPVGFRTGLRPGLGWIAVNAERDNPPRPVNVPTASWATRDLVVGVTHNGDTINCRTRYAVAGVSDPLSFTDVYNNLPQTDIPPAIPDDAMVVVFMHGHSSSLEEACSFYEHLQDAAEDSCLSRPLVLIAFDYPSNGYSQYFDHDVISPLDTTTRFVPDRPDERRFGILEYYEAFTVAFVEQLDRLMTGYGHPGILDRIAAVIGGSMGGNLALRLSEKLVTDTEWLNALVSWSPASSYVSFGRKDYFIPSPGEHVDVFGKEALERTRIRCREAESDGSRGTFMSIQLSGERLINDGTPGFEIMTRLLAVIFQPLVGGLAPLIPIAGPLVGPIASGLVGPVIFGSAALEGVANIIAIKQSDTWLSELAPECLPGWDTAMASQGALLHLNELYCADRRRMHWRVAYEQLLFSHQDEIAASRGVPCYEASTIPTLLIGGANDSSNPMTGFDIYRGVQFLAPRMINNPGTAIYAADTGHSMHVERPKWLASEIHKFICSMYAEEVVAVSREGGKITALHFGPRFKPVSVEDAIERIEDGTARYYIGGEDGARNIIYVKRYLTTNPDDTTSNNLRSLPETSLPSLSPGESSGYGRAGRYFQVTHLRLAGAGRTPWESWITHLCNDALEIQIPIQQAEDDIERDRRQYYIRTDEGENILQLAEYLTTYPNESTEDNLSSLPEAD